MVVVFRKPDDPYLADIVVGIITRMGMYLNQSQAQWLIAQGKVVVDGEVLTDPAEVLSPDRYNFVIGDRKVEVELRETQTL